MFEGLIQGGILVVLVLLALAAGQAHAADVAAQPTPAPPEGILGLLGPVISCALGVLWRRTEEVQKGKRWSWRAVALDGPSAIGLGMLAGSICRWLGFGEELRLGISCGVGYLGTSFLIERILPRLLNRIGPADQEKKEATDA